MYLWQNRSKQSVPFIENSDISSFGRTLVFPKITTGKNVSLNDLKRICEQKEKKNKKEVSNYQKSSTQVKETEWTKEYSRIVEKISAKTFFG